MADSADAPIIAKTAQVYRELQRRLGRSNAMDFDDLLVNAYELLSKNPDVLMRYQQRFLRISVDEYQDTNHVQYLITNLLASAHRNLMVVGDDDQSIYFMGVVPIFVTSWIFSVIILMHRWSSSKKTIVRQGHILGAANAVVANNSRRTPKRLFTSRGDGDKVCVYQASDERDEGRWIASEIDKLHDKGMSFDDMAVFYRTNAQSRTIEDMFLRAGVPYKIVGGTRLF